MTVIVVFAVLALVGAVVVWSALKPEDHRRPARAFEPAPPRRRVRFEESLEVTVPEDDADLAASPEPDTFIYAPEPVEERIPLHVRVFGAIRLALLIAVTAAVVAASLWAAAYMLNQQFAKVVER